MPPFLVPIADVARVQGDTEESTQKAVLPQFSTSPASGGPKTLQHYTNIFRVECLARSHPLVNKVELHKTSKSRDKATFDDFGRAKKFHQSPHDLRLSLGSSVAIDDTSHTLLSLWWQPAGGCRLTKEQESLAQAVSFDLVEAVHVVRPTCTLRTTTLPLARPLLLLQPRTTTLPLALPLASRVRPRARGTLQGVGAAALHGLLLRSTAATPSGGSGQQQLLLRSTACPGPQRLLLRQRRPRKLRRHS